MIKEDNIDSFLIEKDYILSVHNNSVYNKVIKEYYKRLYEESGIYLPEEKKSIGKRETLKSKLDSLDKCNKFWIMDVYNRSLIKDFVSTNLCKDKFCNNCKKVKQATRMSKYISELEPYKNNLYHITFTIPNVKGEELRNTIKKMSKAFNRLFRYIKGLDKINGVDFCKYGYKGAVRSLEITFNENEYHPHYHCAFIFDNLDVSNRIYKNQYSIDFTGSREERLFSEFEILIQKLWYLCYNEEYINYKRITTLVVGYSCLIEKFNDNDYAELFKYMTKETDEKDNILTYENFKTLYQSTFALKQIQGYGCLYKITDKDLTEEVDKVYADIIKFLSQENEKPVSRLEQPYDLLTNDNFKIISRKKIYQYLNEKG